MPFPILKPTPEPVPQESKSCRVFVSYSHRDTEAAKRFIKFLVLQLVELKSLGVREEQVFFDARNLLAGDEWDDSIQRALEEAEYFIFLVSEDSLSSKYCVGRELKLAVERGVPIVPIILRSCPWEGQPLPGDAKNRMLKALGALPKDDKFELRPVANWQSGEADAWNTVVNQLSERLLRDLGKPLVPTSIVQVAKGSVTQRLSPLLPYFCNQVAAVTGFNGRVRQWSSSALLVLFRGNHDDNLPRFWDRLRTKNVADYLQVNSAQLLEPRPLVWPQDSRRKRTEDELSSDMLGALSESLTGNSFQLKDAAALGSWLVALRGVVPLSTTLPPEKKPILSAGLRALLGLLDQCPAQTPLHRLVIAAVLEHETMLSDKDLVKSLKLAGYRNTHVIDVAPLEEIESDDIRRWHRDHDIEALCCVTEADFLNKVLGDALSVRLRLGTFDSRAKPILGF